MNSNVALRIWLLATLASCMSAVNSAAHEAALQLMEQLRNHTHSGILPKPSPEQPLVVRYNFALSQLVEVDTRQSTVTLSIWSRIRWQNPSIAWDPESYDGIQEIVFGAESDFWIPDVFIHESLEEAEIGTDFIKASINYKGEEKFLNPRILRIICDINVRYFPFDTQVCRLTVGSWSYRKNDIEIDTISEPIECDLSISKNHIEWEIVSCSGDKGEHDYRQVGANSVLVYKLIIRRKPWHYILNLILPTLFIGFLGGCVFFIPAETGELFGFAITILLALTVNLLVVSEELPATSNNEPIVTYLYLTAISMSTVSIVFHTWSINIHYPMDKLFNKSGWMYHFFVEKFGKVVLSKRFMEQLKRCAEEGLKAHEEVDASSGERGHNGIVTTQGHVNSLFKMDDRDESSSSGPEERTGENVPRRYKTALSASSSTTAQSRYRIRNVPDCHRSKTARGLEDALNNAIALSLGNSPTFLHSKCTSATNKLTEKTVEKRDGTKLRADHNADSQIEKLQNEEHIILYRLVNIFAGIIYIIIISCINIFILLASFFGGQLDYN